MEVSDIGLRRVTCLLGAATDGNSSSVPSGARVSGDLRVAPRRVGESFRGLSSRFMDDGSLQYYYASVRCGGGKEKAAVKKKLKVLRRLSKDLPMLQSTLFGEDLQLSLNGQVKDRIITDASEVLLKRLEEMRAEEKRKKKEEKARRKAMRQRELSSSESSESDCGCEEVVEMRRMREEAKIERLVEEEEEGEEESNGGLVKQLGNRIEVCMGNKCKKSGGAALMEEFERVMGGEGAVVGCKCMGKCRDGPNVKVLKGSQSEVAVRNPLCIGVGLEDVEVIVTNLLGQDTQHLCLSPAS